MLLSAGTRLGSYEILSALGAGGMGEVYRARDTKLGRDVALKILPDAFASDPDRLARFQREARVLASLNHPNIGGIYGLEEANPSPSSGQAAVTALVMELVEGETLEGKIRHGSGLMADGYGRSRRSTIDDQPSAISHEPSRGLPVDEALAIARQIAEALEAAHEQGIIHRDLKPANIKVRADGTVKVLDFGLAKAMEPVGSAPNISRSPTITTPAMMTGVGVILGSAAYMSPEQAKGRAADKRSDVWSFGCVLYEMLTAKRAFEGEDVADTIAEVLKGDPDWAALPSTTPPSIRALVEGCLRKDRKQRIGDISTALYLLNQPATTLGAAPALVAPPRPPWRRALPVVVTAVVVFALTAGVMWRLRPSIPAPVMRFAIAIPDGQQLTANGRAIAVSPAGTRIVYLANQRLYLRSLSDLEVRPIVSAENAGSTPGNPVFSPDGGSIAYFEQGTIKRIALSGGAAMTVCEADQIFGMSWNGDTIFFGQGSKGIMRVSANGGKPETVASVKMGELAHGPQLLPDGQTLMFTLATGTGADRWDKAHIVAESLTSHERQDLDRRRQRRSLSAHRSSGVRAFWRRLCPAVRRETDDAERKRRAHRRRCQADKRGYYWRRAVRHLEHGIACVRFGARLDDGWPAERRPVRSQGRIGTAENPAGRLPTASHVS